MAIIVELAIPADGFPLGTVFARAPDVTIELERVVPFGSSVFPFLWVIGKRIDAFERAVRDADVVESLDAITRLDDRALYQVTWTDAAVADLTGQLAEPEVTILRARADPDWTLQLRFAEQRALDRFHARLQTDDVPTTITRVFTQEESMDGRQTVELSAAQREAIVLAVERGFYDVPRRASLKDIADEAGISKQAMSERLRRGSWRVFTNVFDDRSAADLD
jgi:predicted DNA binding protein